MEISIWFVVAQLTAKSMCHKSLALMSFSILISDMAFETSAPKYAPLALFMEPSTVKRTFEGTLLVPEKLISAPF